MNKIVYVMCSFDGDYEGTLTLNQNQIINEDYTSEEWGGYPLLTWIDEDGNEDETRFISKTIVD